MCHDLKNKRKEEKIRSHKHKQFLIADSLSLLYFNT